MSVCLHPPFIFSFHELLALHISFVGMTALLEFWVLHRKGNILGCYIIKKEIEFWIMGYYKLFFFNFTPLALLRYCVIQKREKKLCNLVDLDVSCIHYSILQGYL